MDEIEVDFALAEHIMTIQSNIFAVITELKVGLFNAEI